MRKINVVLLVILCFCSSGFTKQKKYLLDKNNTPIERVVSLLDLDDESIEKLFKEGKPEVAIECVEGTKLPLQYLGNFGALSLHFDPNLTISLEKTCYIRMMKRKKHTVAYISFDLKNWEKFSSYMQGKLVPHLGFENSSIGVVKTKLVKD